MNSQAVARPGAVLADPNGRAAAEPLNMSVVIPTTPANYFHVLRRQIARPFRKPLVIIAPKTLLRLDAAVSSLADMAPGSRFQPVLVEDGPSTGVTRVLIVAGKLYYELVAARAKSPARVKDTVILRVEELAPFPSGGVVDAVKKYKKVDRVCWVQEEPANAGAWTWAEAHLVGPLAAAGLPSVTFVGRPALPTPAVGLSKRNAAQQAALIAAALG